MCMFPKVAMYGATLAAWKSRKWQLAGKSFDSCSNTGVEIQVLGNHIQPFIHNTTYSTITQAKLSTGSSFDNTINPISRQNICNDILLAWPVHNVQVEFSHTLQPTSLSGVQMGLGVDIL